MKKLLLSLLSVILVVSMCVSCSTGVANTVKTTVETSTETTPSGVVSTDSYLNGTKLDDYVIIYNSADHDYSLRAAKYIQNEIFARTEVGIEIIEDNSQSTSDYEIIVGDTNRELSKSFSAPSRTTEFALNANETQIAMKGEYFVIAAAAYFFIETYVPQDNFDANVPKELCIHKPIVEEAKN